MTRRTVTLALPSKGRLKEQCEAWLAERGLRLVQAGGARGYSAALESGDGRLAGIEVRLASPSEIGRALTAGEVDFGVTGEDIVREAVDDPSAWVDIHRRLGFGRADVVVAAPDGWVDVERMADLVEVAADLRRKLGRRFRVATKFTRMASAFLAGHGMSDHRLVDSAGATEGAPAAGMADCIVDITTSGATLRANGLKMLSDGIILRSEACLISARTSAAGRGAPDPGIVAGLMARLAD